MRCKDWLRTLLLRRSARSSQGCRFHPDTLVPQLSVIRLEERRVLNADAAPAEVLLVDAGEAADDGQADTFQVEYDAGEVHVYVNGLQTHSALAENISQIRVNGSFDDDVLIADLLAGAELIFDGQAGNDRLLLESGSALEQVTYDLTKSPEPTDGGSELQIHSGDASIQVRGVEDIVDRSEVQTREFIFDLPGQEISVVESAERADASRLTAEGFDTQITFVNPTELLRVNTAHRADADVHQVVLAGLGAEFDASVEVIGTENDWLHLTGNIDLGAGSLIATTGSIVLDQQFNSEGGKVDLQAYDRIEITDQADLSVAGGVVTLDSGEQGLTVVAGIIDVSDHSLGGKGGVVQILGGSVGVMGAARIDASGAAGGGTVLIGGDYQGKNSSIRNAGRSYVGPQTSILADAVSHGNGGTIIVWAEELAQVHGVISAAGGFLGGDGGLVETSGRQLLELTVAPNVGARQGVGGTWFIDPNDIEIVAGNGNTDINNMNPFVSTDDSAELGVDLITAALTGGANVTVMTGNGGMNGEDGDITLSTMLDFDGTGNNSLSLIASDDIIINGAILDGTPGADMLNLTLQASNGDATDGDNIAINNAISLGGGSLTLNAAGDVTQSASLTVAQLDVTNTAGETTLDDNANAIDALGTMGTAGGALSLTNTVPLTLNGAINAGAQTFEINNGANAVTFALGGANDVLAATFTVVAEDVDALDTVGSFGTTDVVLQPDATTDTIGLAVVDAATFTLTAADIAELESNAGAVVIGQTNQTGALTLGGAVNLASRDVTIRSGRVNDGVNAISATNLTLDLDSETAGAHLVRTTVSGSLAINSADGNNATDRSVTVVDSGTLELATLDAGNGTIRIVANGNVTQAAATTITAAALGVRQVAIAAGNVLLGENNDVDQLAVSNAANNGTLLFRDADGVNLSSVADSGPFLATDGVTTNDGDVKLIVGDIAGENLTIDNVVNLGAGDLFLDVAGNVTQAASINARGLALMVAGTTTLELANDVNVLAANAGGTILYNDADDLTIGTVTALDGTADEMTATGVTTSNDDVKLIVGDAIGENLDVNQAVNLGTGDLFFDVAGNVMQTATITASGLALMVDGTTTLDQANDVDTLAADNGDTILYNDVDDLTIGAVTALDGTADEMTVTGITTSGDDVKLIVGDAAGENLAINQAINLGTGDLLLDVADNVTQAAAGTITAAGLALMVDGTTTLDQANDVDTLAADNGDTILYNDVDDLTIGAVTALDGTADQMTVTGITTSGDDVKLIVGDAAGENLAINQAINLGAGDLALDVADNVTQAAAGTITAAGLALMVDGTTTLTLATNNVTTLAADNGESINYTDNDGLTIDTVTVFDGTPDEMTVTDVSTANVTTPVMASGSVTITSDNGIIELVANVTTGDATVADAAGATAATSGNITLTAAVGIIGGGIVTTGNVQVDATTAGDVDIATSGTITLEVTVAEDVGLSGTNALTIGSATVINLTADDTATAGNITVVSADRVNNGTEGDPLDVSFGTASGGATNTAGLLSITTMGGADAAGEIQVTSGEAVTLGQLDTDNATGQNVAITVSGGALLTVGETSDLDTDNVILTTDEIDVRDIGSDGDITATFTAGTITVQPSTATTPIDLGSETAGSLSLTDAELDEFADLTLKIGSTVAGPITISATITPANITNLVLLSDSAVSQAAGATVAVTNLGLMVTGDTMLGNANDVNSLVANNGGTILFRDVDDVSIEVINAPGMTVTGITTSGDDVKLIVGDAAGENLAINQAINLGTGDLLLDVAGNVTQAAAVTITAAGLALMVDGTTTLDQANDVDTLAADNGDTILYNDADDLTIGTVTALDGTADEMTATGVTTSNDDVKLIVGDAIGENLDVNQAVNLGTGDLFFDVAGNVMQTATITASGLALMVDGTTTLDQANDVDTLAADNGDTILYNDVDDLTIGAVTALDGTADEMTVTGITTSGDDVKLIVGDAAGENLAINQAINLGTGDLLLDVADNVTQAAAGTITAAGLALMVDGTTTLDQANDVDTLAADNGDTILYNDVDDLTIGAVTALDGTADQMTVTGITTSGDDVKLIVGDAAGENLAINQAINLGAGDLALDVAGDVDQSAVIASVGLALRVDGNTNLNLANDVNTLAANSGGAILYNDVDDLTVGTVTVLDGDPAQEMIIGVTAIGDISLATTSSDLTTNQSIVSTMNNVNLSADNTLSINADVVATNGRIDLAVMRNEIAAFAFNAGVLRSSGGNVTPSIFSVDNIGVDPRFEALDASDDMSLQPITTGSIATIEVIVTDATADSTLTIEIDWRESNGAVSGVYPSGAAAIQVNPDPDVIPGPLSNEQLNAQVIDSELAPPLLPLGGFFHHRYIANPDGADSPFILAPVAISAFAGGMVDIEIGNEDLQDFVQAAGTLVDQDNMPVVLNGNFDTQIGIMVVVRLEVLDFLVGQSLPLPEALPSAPPAGPTMMPAAAPTPLVVQVETTPHLPNTARTTGQAEQRYYELRIVTFNAQRELVETPDQRINLNDDQLRAIAPFNPSKLPELFKRLPGDRYRLYLVEDGAERLVLEFVIERAGGEGRPVELPERTERQQLKNFPEGEKPIGEAALEKFRSQEFLHSPLLSPVETTNCESEFNSQDDFAELLGRASFVASSGVLFGAAMFTERARKRREDQADARMATFRKRLRLQGSSKLSNAAHRPYETVPKDS